MPVKETARKSRILIADNDSRRVIRVNLRASGGEAIALGLGLCPMLVASAAFGYMIEAEFRHSQALAPTAFGIALALGGVAILVVGYHYMLLRLLGRQEIVVTSDKLSVTTKVAGIRWSRCWPLPELGPPRIDERRVARKGGSRLVRDVALAHGSKTVRLGLELSREEANELQQALASFFGPVPLEDAKASGGVSNLLDERPGQ